MHRNCRILCRVIAVVVNAVDDSAELVFSGCEKTLQAFAVPYCADLFSVCRAYSSNCVRINHSALHEVDSIIVYHLPFSRSSAKTEDIIDHVSAVLTLELQIMDRENSLDAVIDLFSPEEFSEVDRDKRSMPVIAVKDIRSIIFADVADRFKYCYREERYSFTIVEFAIYPGSSEVVFVVEEIICDAALSEGKKSAVQTSPAQSYFILLDEFHFLSVFVRNRTQKRKNDSRVVFIIFDICRK